MKKESARARATLRKTKNSGAGAMFMKKELLSYGIFTTALQPCYNCKIKLR